MIVMGLTGDIACGKSTVGKMLEELGVERIDADLVIHELMAPGKRLWAAMVDEFGSAILNSDQTINRAKVASIVFHDPDKLKRLEEMTYPMAKEVILGQIAKSKRDVAVLEAVKLVESGWAIGRDILWVVTCSPDTQLERMVRDRGMTEEDARARLSAQPPVGEKLRLAKVVIDNSGTREETFEQVKRGLERIVAESRG